MKKTRNQTNLLGMWFVGSWLLLSLMGCKECPKQEDKFAGLGFEWITIEGGTYMMGSPDGKGMGFEHPLHEEKIKTFEVLKTEVTVPQYEACVKAKACWKSMDMNPDFCNWGRKDRRKHPINCVNWYQANTFCTWIDARLPTEAEWEYMARSGGKDYKYPWGNEEMDCSRAAMDIPPGVNCGKYKGSTAPVCSKPKGMSEQGVCDLMGNVHEWTGDWFYPSYDKSTHKEVPKMLNGATKVSSYHRVLRGGGIGSEAGRYSRARVLHDPPFSYVGLGIRCVRTSSPSSR